MRASRCTTCSCAPHPATKSNGMGYFDRARIRKISMQKGKRPAAKQVFSPKKRLGQHFLSDSKVLTDEAALLECNDESVLEIGGGDGRFSEKILAENPSAITIVEIDQLLVKKLKFKFAKDKRVAIKEADILEMLGGLRWDEFKFSRVAGNIPYQISGPLFASLMKFGFVRGVFCIQKEVAERLAAMPGSADYGRLSVVVQLHYRVKIAFGVPRFSFVPPPKVDSAVIVLEQNDKQIALPENFHQILTALFSHRRKSVANAIHDARAALSISKEEAKELGRTIKYGERKVFTLTPLEWAELAREIAKG